MIEQGLGCYVYCVVRAGEHPSLEGLEAVDPVFGIEPLTHADLSALTSRVRLEEFGAEALKRNLEDLGWVERTARAHDAVLARALTADAVVPLRLCTIFADEAHVRDMLEREEESLLEALERLRGHAEWSVKVLVKPRELEAAARARSPEPAATAAAEQGSPGRAFFERKKVDRGLREEARSMADAAAEEVHMRLGQEAAAATLLPPQHPELSRRSGEMVLNGAYLVHRSRSEDFAAAAGDLRDRHSGIGIELDISGPWAPYNFVTPPQEARRDER
jgi:hypothetical protein